MEFLSPEMEGHALLFTQEQMQYLSGNIPTESLNIFIQV